MNLKTQINIVRLRETERGQEPTRLLVGVTWNEVY